MAAPKDGKKKSETEETIERIKTGVKVAAFAGLSGVAVAAKVVSAGAKVVQKTATKTRNDLLK